MKSQHPYGPRNWHFQLRRSNLITRARTLKLKLVTIPAWSRKQKFFDTLYLRGKRQCRWKWARFPRQAVKRRRQCKGRQQAQPGQSLAENGFEDSEDEENGAAASWIKIPVEKNSHAFRAERSQCGNKQKPKPAGLGDGANAIRIQKQQAEPTLVSKTTAKDPRSDSRLSRSG